MSDSTRHARSGQAQKEKVYLGLSGGVDSAVAAALLLEQGYDVHGVFLKIWSDEDEGNSEQCPWVLERQDALAVAAKLNIPLKTIDFQKQYKDDVFSYFVEEYSKGRTPNPDILCNTIIKFGNFLELALGEGADYIATGHHVRRSPESGKEYEQVVKLLSGVDNNKDQSYFLAGLNQYQLRHSLFPIGNYTKDQVREMATKYGLDNVAGKQSTRGICFVGKVKMKDFLGKYENQKHGHLIHIKTGEVIGHHDGVQFFTIGQRHGFEVTKKGPTDGAYYVVSKNPETNELVVTNDPQDPELHKKEVIVSDLHWIDGKLKDLPLECKARIRYRQELQDCVLHGNRPDLSGRDGQAFNVIFDQPQKAVAPGQIVAFYDGEELLGNGVIA